MESILLKFDEDNHLSTDLALVREFLQSILQCNERHFSIHDFLHHRSVISLRTWYFNLLQQWNDGQQTFDQNMIYVFETIPHLFLKLSNYLSDENVQEFKEFLCYQPMIDELNRILEQIATNGKYLQDSHIRSLDNLIRAIQRLQRTHSEKNLDSLFDRIVKCICSNTFFELFLQSTTQELDHPGQKFLLHTCTDYIYSYPNDVMQKQSLLDIRRFLLHRFVQWFSQQSSSYRSWNHRLSVTLRQLCFILTLSIQQHRSIELDRETFHDFCQLADAFVNILYSILQSENSTNQKLSQSLLATITPNLYTMISSNQLEKYLKNKHITSLILRLIEVENEEIQMNAFRIIAAILTEQDTKILSNATNIAQLFLKFLNKTIDDDDQILRFYSLIQSLKDVIHYDQIKEELTKQNGIPLLLRCATEMKFKPLQVQQPALEILLALTFNKDAYRQLKEHSDQFHSLCSSPHQGISRAANCLRWRFEKIDKPSPNNYQYDLLISYSHANQEFVDRISDQLTNDHFHVYLDSDESSFDNDITSKITRMDQSRCILLCLSDEYKQNSYCRCEAFYAHERQYKIIPLILTLNFHLDTWLFEIIKGKIYIDFMKLDFQLAYQTLKNELNRDGTIHRTIEVEPIVVIQPKIIESVIPLPSKSTSSLDIQQWSIDDVRGFLMEKQFDSLVPILAEMDGCLLIDFYTMCKENRESMFHTLKNELVVLDSSIPPLTIFNYLRFLREIDRLILS